MSDHETSISTLKAKVAEFNGARDWERYHSPKNTAISVSIEAAELLELFQWDDLDAGAVRADTALSRKVGEEMADIAIYLLGLANTLGLDLSRAILAKLEKNEERYPVVDLQKKNGKLNL